MGKIDLYPKNLHTISNQKYNIRDLYQKEYYGYLFYKNPLIMKNNENNMRNDKIIIEPKSISMNIENKAIKSICKIKIKKKNENDFYEIF